MRVRRLFPYAVLLAVLIGVLTVAVITIVKNGLEGRVVVNGQAYSGIMPHWKGVLPDEQIASVITYILVYEREQGLIIN